MPTIRWKRYDASPAEAAADSPYLVMATRLPLKQHRSVPGFFRATSKIRRQLASADGLIGYTLRAQPLRKTFWTVSVWRDQASLDRFAAAEPHNRIVRTTRPQMGQSTFVTWTCIEADLPPAWPDARRRIAATAAGEGQDD